MWLNGAAVEAEVNKASELTVDVPAEVAAQVQQHIRELALVPLSSTQQQKAQPKSCRP